MQRFRLQLRRTGFGVLLEAREHWRSETGRQSPGFAVPSSFNETLELQQGNLSRGTLTLREQQLLSHLSAFLRSTRLN